jgi:hypothetical protein
MFHVDDGAPSTARASRVTKAARSFFGKHKVRRLIGRKVVPQLPNLGDEQGVGIPSNP